MRSRDLGPARAFKVDLKVESTEAGDFVDLCICLFVTIRAPLTDFVLLDLRRDIASRITNNSIVSHDFKLGARGGGNKGILRIPYQ